MAARNNADLYEAVFRSRGLEYVRTPAAFIAGGPPPPYYSHLTILSEGYPEEVKEYLRQLSSRFGGAIGYKDSFSELDLRDQGFDLLFEASWIYRPEGPAREQVGWERVTDARSLEQWEDAWKAAGSPTEERMFCASLLQAAEITILGKRTDAGSYAAGCIANVSESCIGMSNLFSLIDCDLVGDATGAVASVRPDLPIVGYASGGLLASACQAGYRTTGDLRIFAGQSARL